MPIIYSAKPLRPRQKADHYPTPSGLVRASFAMFRDHFPEYEPQTIIDTSAGTGVWGAVAKSFWPASHLTGIELQVSCHPSAYDVWHPATDFMWWAARWMYAHPRQPFCLIPGNPPYGFPHKRSAEFFVRLSMMLAKPGGYVMQLLRLAFLEGQDRSKHFFKELPHLETWVCTRRPSYTGNGKTDSTAYAVLVWQKGVYPSYAREYRLDWEYGERIPEDEPLAVRGLLTDSQHVERVPRLQRLQQRNLFE